MPDCRVSQRLKRASATTAVRHKRQPPGVQLEAAQQIFTCVAARQQLPDDF